MIISFTARNYKSIKEETTLHFDADSTDGIHPCNIAFPDKNAKIPVLRSVGIWGPNASGKSNMLDALNALQFFVATSQRNELDDPIEEYCPFKLDPGCRGGSIFFELDFIDQNKDHFTYTVEFLEDKVIFECLEFYATSKPTKLFTRERINDKLGINFSAKLTGSKKIPCLDNQGYLSVAANQTDSSELIKNVYRYIRGSIVFVAKRSGLVSGKRLLDQRYADAVASLLSCADTGIFEVKCKEKEVDENLFRSDIPEEIKQKIYNEIKWEPKFFHNGSDVEFTRDEESQGTLKLYTIAPVLLYGLSRADVFIFDEIDCQLHPKIVEMVVRLFHDPKVNSTNPQLLFSTHNTALMNPELFRRDQICFTQKGKEGATELTCLSEFKQVRADTNFEKWYRDGRFDAIPELHYNLLRDHILTLTQNTDGEGPKS